MKTWKQFVVGDIVSRHGDDEQEIIGKNDFGDMIEVRCIKPDHNDVFVVGNTESNVAWRYEFVRTSSGICVKNEGERQCQTMT